MVVWNGVTWVQIETSGWNAGNEVMRFGFTLAVENLLMNLAATNLSERILQTQNIRNVRHNLL